MPKLFNFYSQIRSLICLPPFLTTFIQFLDGVLRRHYFTPDNSVQPWLLIKTLTKGTQSQIICTLVALLNMPHDRLYTPKYPTRRKFTNDGRACESDVGGLSIVWVREGVANGLCATTLSM